MKLIVGNVSTSLPPTDADTPRHRQYLKGLLSYNVERHRGKPFRASMYSLATDSFPTGLLSYVCDRCREENYPFELFDTRTAPAVDATADVSWLRDYQIEALNAAMKGCRGIISMATGTGKTEVIIAMLKMIQGECLVITPGVTLMHQFADRLRARTGIVCGKVGDGCTDYKARIVAGTPESLYNHMDDVVLSRFACVIVDEAHGVPSENQQSVLRRCTGAYYRFGYSATPLSRTDGRDTITVAHLGPVLFSLPPAEAVKRGIIATPTVTMLRYYSPTPPATTESTDWSHMHDEMISQNDHRSAAVARWLYTKTKPALVFVKETEHVRRQLLQLGRLNIPSNWVVGEMKQKERDAAVNLLTIGATRVMVATSAFRQAVDIPCLGIICNTGGGEAVIDTIQKLGRGVRKASGKDTVEVLDIMDMGCELCRGGFLHAACRAVATHSARRRFHYVSAGFMVTEVECPTG